MPILAQQEYWPAVALSAMHSHSRDQLLYSQSGTVHVLTDSGRWILPPSRALWIAAGIKHAFAAKRPVELNVLYIDVQAAGSPAWKNCVVLNVSPLVRALINACSALPEVYEADSKSGRLAQVLLEQLEALPQAPLVLPEPRDPRAHQLAVWLRNHTVDRTPLAQLAQHFGGSVKTFERLFRAETGMSFGAWRLRLRLIDALERLAAGDSVSDVAQAVGYESPSSFIAAFKASFGVTPARYFE